MGQALSLCFCKVMRLAGILPSTGRDETTRQESAEEGGPWVEEVVGRGTGGIKLQEEIWGEQHWEPGLSWRAERHLWDKLETKDNGRTRNL